MRFFLASYICLLALQAAAGSYTFESQNGEKIKGQFLTTQGTNVVVLGEDKKKHTIPLTVLTEQSKAYVEKASNSKTESGATRGEWVLDPKWEQAEARILKLQKRANLLHKDYEKSSMARTERMGAHLQTFPEDRNSERVRRSMDAVVAEIQKNRAIQVEVEARYRKPEGSQ